MVYFVILHFSVPFFLFYHDSSQKDYVLQALNAKKHVLANDPTSVKLSDFMEELECAKKNGKFIQTTAMFVHQYRVQRFLNHVLQDDNFGRITEVDASIQLNNDDVEKVGVELPLRREDGCIRVLGRFCVLVSTMFFNRVGSYAESAKVKSWTRGLNGEIVSADCTVNFTNVSKRDAITHLNEKVRRRMIIILYLFSDQFRLRCVHLFLLCLVLSCFDTIRIDN